MKQFKPTHRLFPGLVAAALFCAPLAGTFPVLAAGPSCPIDGFGVYATYGMGGDPTGVQSTTVELNASNSFACGGANIVSYVWNFGDGTTGEGAVVSHTYGVGSFRPTVTVTDNLGNTSTSRLYQTVTVKENNTAPSVQDIELSTLNTYSYDLDLRSVISDADADGLHIVLSQLDYPLSWSYDGDRQFKIYTINGSMIKNTTVTIQYTVSDQYSEGVTGYATIQFLNTAPVAGAITATATEDSFAQIDTYPHISDRDKDNLDVSISQPQNGTAYVSAGVITYQPNPNFNGTDSLTYTVNDGRASSSATVVISVAPQNDAPVWTSSSWSTSEDTPITINPLAGVSDVDGDQLRVTDARVGTPNASVTVNQDGTVTIAPNENIFGSFYLYTTISDGAGSYTRVSTISVSSVNDTPVIASLSATSVSRAGKSYQFISETYDVDRNDSLTYSWDFGDGSRSAGGSSTRHDFKRKGTYIVTLTVTDASGAIATKTVSVNV